MWAEAGWHLWMNQIVSRLGLFFNRKMLYTKADVGRFQR